MTQRKSAVFVFSINIIMSLVFYHYNDISSRFNIRDNEKVNRELIYVYTGQEDFLINTPGCVIPNYEKKLVFAQTKHYDQTCGERAVFVEVKPHNRIVFLIDTHKMQRYMINDTYKCCYTFVSRTDVLGKEDTDLMFTPCYNFNNGTVTKLEEEVITVYCSSETETENVYEDAFIRVKRIRTKIRSAKGKWNVLILGLDTMSRARVFSETPKLAKYIQENGWLDYRGYNKIGYNTYPNLISMLTGMNISSIDITCKPTMSTCNERIIWSTFYRAGYVTAYGEDNLELPDTFTRFNGFQSIPTHHYMRSLFLTGEVLSGNVVCTKHLTSGKHVLDYANDFTNNYKKQSFFGMFWINSGSHNTENIPSLHENDIINFLDSIKDNGFLKNTFVLLLSDHGIRFGPNRWPIESYYEERMPMFFISVPSDFRKGNSELYYNLQLNQNRLISPYDVYKTLVKISNMSMSSTDITSAGCPTCITLFEKASQHRLCADAGINDKWCACHDMKVVDSKTKSDAKISVQIAVSHINDNVKKAKTKNKCWECRKLQLDYVIRSHSYTYLNRTYFVIAFEMKPGKVAFEVTILKDNKNYSVLHSADTITGYNSQSTCVVNSVDRKWCICKRVKCHLHNRVLSLFLHKHK